MLILSTVAAIGTAASAEVRLGKPLVHNYTYRDFGADAHNWDVVQDRRGVMYFANSAGVLEYDGSTWRLIELPSRLEARSLALGHDQDRVYVGGRGDFGYLEPDPSGQLRFVSLLPHAAEEDSSFDLIFTVMVTRSGVYFQSREKLCRLIAEALDCRHLDGGRSRAFAAGGSLYVQQVDVGLLRLVDDVLEPLPGGERFAEDDIALLLAWPDDKSRLPRHPPRDETSLLVGTPDFHLFHVTGRSIRPFGSALREPLMGDRLLGGTVLLDGSLALITLRRGVLVIDGDGRIRDQLDESTGLTNAHIRAIWPDRSGRLWLALYNGISRVDMTSAYSVVDEDSGVESEWTQVVRHQGVLYARGYGGLFAADLVSEDSPGALSRAPHSVQFTRVRINERPTWSLVSTADTLLVSAGDEIYEVRAKQAQLVVNYGSAPVTMYRSRTDPDRVYVGLVGGVASLRWSDGSWLDEGRIDGIDDTITSIAESPHGDVWLVSQRQRVIRLRRRATEWDDPSAAVDPHKLDVQLYPSKGTSLGLVGRVAVEEISSGPVFLSEEGIYTFDDAADRFVPAPEFAALTTAGRRSFVRVAEDTRGNIWVLSRKPGGIDFLRKDAAGRHVVENAGIRQGPAWCVYPEPGETTVWFCTPDHLLRYAPTGRYEPSATTDTLIRRVVAETDGVLYGGAAPSTAAGPPAAEPGQPRLPYRANSLHFEFALPAYEDATRNEFQVYLEGFDEGWSDWTPRQDRRYTNLPDGHYRFHVRGRDVRGDVGATAVFGFSIQPPWYRSRLAYVLFGSVAFGLLVLVRSIELRKARLAHQRELEQVELEKLRELDRLKSRFFADISHEFRTPVTLILGPVEQLLQEGVPPTVERRLDVVRRSAQRLLRLIGELFDLAKLEAGRVPLQASPGDLVHFIRASITPFQEAASHRDIDLTFAAPRDGNTYREMRAYFDGRILEKVLNNLLWNAMKFTPAGGTVAVVVRECASETSPGSRLDEGTVEIVVSDTGVGIPAKYLPRIFDRFYQVEGPPRLEGIGIGLALVKELVELHRGTIHVESAEGKGTTFAIRFPSARAAFDAVEIAHSESPRRPDPPPLCPPERQDDSPGRHGSADEADDVVTVLVVEDHAEMRDFLREHLEVRYRVADAPSAREGLQTALTLLPDIVVSDVMMPEMDGYELCHALKTDLRTSHIPVILLTARVGREDRLMSLETGADQYLTKPFDSSELLMQIENLVRQRRRLRERFSGSVVLKPAEMQVTSADKAFLGRLLAIVEEHLGDPDFDIARLAREIGFSRSQLHRKVRALTNQPPTLLIRSIRLQRSAELLRQKAGSVAEIAYLVGFKSQSHFGECFREQFGCSPSQYTQESQRQRA